MQNFYLHMLAFMLEFLVFKCLSQLKAVFMLAQVVITV